MVEELSRIYEARGQNGLHAWDVAGQSPHLHGQCPHLHGLLHFARKLAQSSAKGVGRRAALSGAALSASASFLLLIGVVVVGSELALGYTAVDCPVGDK
jgi:hypothetical protein